MEPHFSPLLLLLYGPAQTSAGSLSHASISRGVKRSSPSRAGPEGWYPPCSIPCSSQSLLSV